jgi:ribokinase
VNTDLVAYVRSLPGPGVTVTGGSFEQHGGGKGANQAVAAARLGAATILVAAVGMDSAGDEALAELATEGVDVSRVSRLKGVASGVALIVVDDVGENQIAVASGANSCLDATMVESALENVVMSDDGVCLLGFEVGDGAIEAAAKWASSRGYRLVLDPAPARTIPSFVLKRAPILTPNVGEARQLTGAPDRESAAMSLLKSTGAPVVVTLGAHGVLVLGDGSPRIVRPNDVSAVDTTGAGDAFSGAFAVGLSEGASLADSVDLGQAAAALATMSGGARSGMPTRATLARFMASNRRTPES